MPSLKESYFLVRRVRDDLVVAGLEAAYDGRRGLHARRDLGVCLASCSSAFGLDANLPDVAAEVASGTEAFPGDLFHRRHYFGGLSCSQVVKERLNRLDTEAVS